MVPYRMVNKQGMVPYHAKSSQDSYAAAKRQEILPNKALKILQSFQIRSLLFF